MYKLTIHLASEPQSLKNKQEIQEHFIFVTIWDELLQEDFNYPDADTTTKLKNPDWS